MKSLVHKFAILTSLGLVLLAVLDQLVRDPKFRTWHGAVFGVPYDFRLPTLERIRLRLWAPDTDRLLVPVVVGVGWSINLGCLARRASAARPA